MIIPSKFNGFHGGVRRCFGGGGGGGGAGGDGGTGDAASAAGGAVGPGASGTGNGSGDGGGSGPGDAGGGGNNFYALPTTPPPTNTNTNFGNSGTTGIYSGPGVSTQQGMNTLGAAKGTPWGQSGAYYNDLLNQGFTSNQIRNSASTMYGAPSDANWGAMVQNAGMNSPTGRPMAGSDQFFQPVYNTSYQNYARPATQFDTSMYGTQPVYSPARAWNDRNSGSAAGGQQVVNNAIGNYFQQNPNSAMSDTLNAMRSSGINRTDIQQWGGVNNYGPLTARPEMQVQAEHPFNPYSNSSGYGGGFGGGLGSVGSANSMAPIDQHGLGMITAARAASSYANSGGPSGMGGFGGMSSYGMTSPPPMQSPMQPRIQNPMSAEFAAKYNDMVGMDDPRKLVQQPQQYNPYQMQSPFSYQQPQQQYNPYQMQSPFSYQQPQQYNPYQQYEQSLGSYNPYQMQSPFSYQQPTPQRTSSGPSQAIVGRSAGMRGTPNVMRRAEGGIASLMDDVE